MKPIRFEGWNTSFADDQPEYQVLPGHLRKGSEGEFISCWKLTFIERLKLLFSGRLFLSCWTFNQPLQPQLPYVENPLLPHEKQAGRPMDWKRPARPENLCKNCGRPAEEHAAPAFKCPK